MDLLKIWSLTNLSADWCNLYQMVGYVLPFCQKLDWWNRYHPIHHLKILKSTEKTPLYASMVVELCPYWAYWHDDDAMRTGPRTNGIRPQEVSQLRRCGLELGNSSCVRNNLGPLKLQLCQSMTVWLWPMWYYSPKDSAYMCIYVHIYIPALMSLLVTSHTLITFRSLHQQSFIPFALKSTSTAFANDKTC